MDDFLVSLINGMAFVLGATGLVLGVYFLTRRILAPGQEGDRTHDVAGNVAVRIATMHALILSLVYAQELDDYKGVRSLLFEEAAAISDVYNDIRRYGGPVVDPVQRILSQYVVVVVQEEWPRLAQRQGLSPKGWQLWEAAYDTVLDLEPSSERQRYLSGRLKDRAAAIAKLRQLREAPTVSHFSGLFWTPALLGLVLVAATFYVYRPTRTHIALLSLFGAYSGVILFFIFAFSNPYSNPGKLQPTAFIRLLEGDLGKTVPKS